MNKTKIAFRVAQFQEAIGKDRHLFIYSTPARSPRILSILDFVFILQTSSRSITNMTTVSPPRTSSSTTASNPDADKAIRNGAIAGGVVGGLAVIGIVVIVLYWIRRRNPRPVKESTKHVDDVERAFPTAAPSEYQYHAAVPEMEQPARLPPSFRPQEVPGGVNQVYELPVVHK
ncbi:uncharacterized protein K460DRAFT_133983 [Cucurbitaria berberidis CBS 394.84]|uniref:Uncharacterized protein n=1 Tax=Cucurbitaria berberidis CBS 394.84 TaxID=1168544 RepID=A0A9P4GBF4_9PLEO|nr:uncharacterized protein K460DRAFT_133983 [Cucurbitaria berberidis CBS 394.84]KAF1842743.1 hypothetical protein K460DRAFT_133983 [Cucurbitaria berberidis CBS 394.84]